MATIKILPEILSNQIAAGEVVERPVSIVKELVENSIDAGASSINIEISKGGKSLIRVSDDGQGMTRDDALLAIERYATSKIFTKEDLFSISTMGFRGEALPSIASVSKFTLITRTPDEDIATRIDMAGGKLLNVSDDGAPAGTMIEIKSLFFNTPARKKFLKSDNTEGGHITDAVLGLALSHQKIRFRLFTNQKLQKNFSLSEDLFQRAVQVFGKHTANQLYRVDGLQGDIKIHGYCSHPSLTRASSGKIFLFVNHRLITDRGLISAIFKGYRGRIMKGRYPLGVFFIDIPYDQVDVNVHPSKREVKFFNSYLVYQTMAQAIEGTLAKAQEDMHAYARVNLPEDIPENRKSFQIEKPAYLKKSLVAEDRVQSDLEWAGFKKKGDLNRIKDQADSDNLKDGSSSITGQFHESPEDKEWQIEKTDDPAAYNETQPVNDAMDSQIKIIGQIMGTYILAETSDGLFMIDQHAAHERIVYEGLKKRHEKLNIQSQDLAIPETIELSYKEADFLKSVLSDLERLGFYIEPFGGSTFVVKSVPAIIDEKETGSMIVDIIETGLDKKHKTSTAEWLEDTLILMACHQALRANKKLHEMEMKKLVKDLEACENSRHCPHGRPIQLFWSKNQIDKLFKRVL